MRSKIFSGSGDLKIKCTAAIDPIYWKSSEESIQVMILVIIKIMMIHTNSFTKNIRSRAYPRGWVIMMVGTLRSRTTAYHQPSLAPPSRWWWWGRWWWRRSRTTAHYPPSSALSFTCDGKCSKMAVTSNLGKKLSSRAKISLVHCCIPVSLLIGGWDWVQGGKFPPYTLPPIRGSEMFERSPRPNLTDFF